jgi:hypothetical protein
MVAKFEFLFLYVPAGTEENHEKINLAGVQIRFRTECLCFVIPKHWRLSQGAGLAQSV